MQLKKEEINTREISRYLGYKGQEPDENVMFLIYELLGELINKINPKYLYKVYDCKFEKNLIFLGNRQTSQEFHISSNHLAYNLRDCHKVYLMAATLGIEADKLLQKYEITNMAKASIVQACGAACIEKVCDLVQNEIAVYEKNQGCYLRPRYSPGYGDLALETQKQIFEQLDCTKRLGLTLTDDLLMYPTKSVTAIIGVTTNEHECSLNKCKTCNNTECEFRDEF